jgi:hypothetical protein
LARSALGLPESSGEFVTRIDPVGLAAASLIAGNSDLQISLAAQPVGGFFVKAEDGIAVPSWEDTDVAAQAALAGHGPGVARHA